MATILTREPDWLSGDLGKYPASTVYDMAAPVRPSDMVTGPIQQSDVLKPLLMDIARNGLAAAYAKFGPIENPTSTAATSKSKHVVIVGAGMAGLVAAYELAKANHKVSILEMQTRVGGRVKTFGEKEGFAKGLYVDAGAMRLPCNPEDKKKIHFLPDYYAKQVFDLPLGQFRNSDTNAFYKFYNMERIQIKAWDKNMFSELWPGWDQKLKESGANKIINTIDEYYSKTTCVVINQLRTLLADAGNNEKAQAKAWKDWIDNWCQFSLSGFLLSDVTAIRTKIKDDRFLAGLDSLEALLPWPEAAVRGYSVYTYTQQLDQSLVQYLREQMGEWWSDHMHHIKGGMSQLPEKFAEAATNKDHPFDIIFNVTVNEIVFQSPEGNLNKEVIVKGYYSSAGTPFELKGNAVIVTTPVHILRQIKFCNGVNTCQIPDDFYKATEDIWYGPSTKIMLQCKTKFWERTHNIYGGFSKTSLPIGQIHYPTSTPAVTLPDSPAPSERGILLVYTWKSEALLFGSLNPIVAIYEAVRQIAEIHPEIKEEFEVGAVEAWYNEPAAQGAYALLKPNQYKNVRYLYQPFRNVYFAGEALSFASGWIQGAMESGLRAAYQFYSRNELND